MKKLVLEEFEVESFVTSPESAAHPGTVRGHSDESGPGFTEGVSCYLSDCGSCRLTCGETAAYSCPPTCQIACAGES